MGTFFDFFTKNFDPITGALIFIVSYLLFKRIKKMMKTLMINSCKIQAVFETIDKHAKNGEGKFLRDRLSQLLTEKQLEET